MKKYLFFLLALVVTSLAFVSCSDDDDDDNQYNSAIVGTWKITEVKTSQSGSYMDAIQDNVCLLQVRWYILWFWIFWHRKWHMVY